MRTRSSLLAAALAVSLTTTFVVPASAQDSSLNSDSKGSSIDISSTNAEAKSSSPGCIATGLAAGLPLLLLVPAVAGANLKIPGLEQLNTQIQRQLGLFNKDLAMQFEQNKQAAGALAGVVGLALGVAGAVFLAKQCGIGDGSSFSGETGSSGDGSSNPGDGSTNPGDGSSDDGSSNLGDGSAKPDDGSSDDGSSGDGSSNLGDGSAKPGDGSSGDGSSNLGDGSTNPGDGSSGDGSSGDGSSDQPTDPADPTKPGDQTIAVGGEFPNYILTALIAAGFTIVDIIGLPEGLTFNAETGAVLGSPTASGDSNVTITLKNKDGKETSITFKLAVSAAA